MSCEMKPLTKQLLRVDSMDISAEELDARVELAIGLVPAGPNICVTDNCNVNCHSCWTNNCNSNCPPPSQ